MNRAQLKQASLIRILEAGAVRLRQEGLAGTAIADVMRDAGLTHGTFYTHFAHKGALVCAVLSHALKKNRLRWIGKKRSESWGERLQRLARMYLTPLHRDHPEQGCALAAVVSEAARADEAFRHAYEQELQASLNKICEVEEGQVSASPQQFQEAIALMALCAGGISLSRAVADPVLSARILEACIHAAGRLPEASTTKVPL